MIPNIKLILYGIAVAALIGAGLYLRHLQKEAGRVDELVATINTQRTQIENERTQIENERTQAIRALEQEHALQKKLAAAESDFARTLDRVRRAYTGLQNTPSDPSDAPGTGRPDPRIGELNAAVERVGKACAAVGVKSGGWRAYWNEVPCELKAEGC